jgi:hypothetical protein
MYTSQNPQISTLRCQQRSSTVNDAMRPPGRYALRQHHAQQAAHMQLMHEPEQPEAKISAVCIVHLMYYFVAPVWPVPAGQRRSLDRLY